MSSEPLEIDDNSNTEHVQKVAVEAKRLDLAAMRTLRDLMDNSSNERVRKEAAQAWLDFQVAREKVNREPVGGGNTFNLIGDEKNVRQIRERILGQLPAGLSAEGETE